MSKSPKQANDLNNFKSPLDKLNKVKLDLAISNKDQKKVAEAIIAKIDAAASILYGDNKDARYKAIINKTVETIIKSLPDFFNDKQFKEDVLATVFADVLKDDDIIEKNSFFKKLKKVLDDNNDRLDDIEDKVDKIRKQLKKEIKLIKKNNKQISSNNTYNNNLLSHIKNGKNTTQNTAQNTTQNISSFKQISTISTPNQNKKNKVNSLNNAVDFFSTKKSNSSIKLNNKSNNNSSNKVFTFLKLLSPGRFGMFLLGKVGKVIFKAGKFIFKKVIEFLKVTLNFLVKTITFTLKIIISIIAKATKFILNNFKKFAALSLATPITQRMLGYIIGIFYYKIIKPINDYLAETVGGPLKKWLNGEITFIDACKEIFTKILNDLKDSVFADIGETIKNVIITFVQDHIIYPLKLSLVGYDESRLYTSEAYDDFLKTKDELDKAISDFEQTYSEYEKIKDDKSKKDKQEELLAKLKMKKNHITNLNNQISLFKQQHAKSFFDILVDMFYNTKFTICGKDYTIGEILDLISMLSTIYIATSVIAKVGNVAQRLLSKLPNAARFGGAMMRQFNINALIGEINAARKAKNMDKVEDELTKAARTAKNASEMVGINFSIENLVPGDILYSDAIPDHLSAAEYWKTLYPNIEQVVQNNKQPTQQQSNNTGKTDTATEIRSFQNALNNALIPENSENPLQLVGIPTNNNLQQRRDKINAKKSDNETLQPNKKQSETTGSDTPAAGSDTPIMPNTTAFSGKQPHNNTGISLSHASHPEKTPNMPLPNTLASVDGSQNVTRAMKTAADIVGYGANARAASNTNLMHNLDKSLTATKQLVGNLNSNDRSTNITYIDRNIPLADQMLESVV